MDHKQIHVLRQILSNVWYELDALENQKKDIEEAMRFLEAVGPEIMVRVVYKEGDNTYSRGIEINRKLDTQQEVSSLKKLYSETEEEIIQAEERASKVAHEAVSATEFFNEGRKTIDYIKETE